MSRPQPSRKRGIKELLENLLVLAEMENLRANPNQPAVGIVIEAGMDKTRGPIATVLIHDGTLKTGDVVVVGTIYGKVKAMFSDTGKRLRRAEPATPVAILGLPSVPQVGDTLNAVADEREAQSRVEKRQGELAQAVPRSVTLDRLYTDISSGKVKELNIVLRADVQGSIEPIRNSLEQLSTDEVKVRIIHSGTGIINESDVMLALASKGLVIGFAVASEPGARRLAEAEGVDIRSYNIIYSLVDDVAKALKGMLEPKVTEVTQGRAEVRAVFTSGKREKVAGIYVTEGKVSRGDQVRVRRGDKVLADGAVVSLRRFKDDVREVAAGYEGGLGIQGFSDFHVGDILESYRKERAG
ncbi:MAG: EF-Tu/IF-2/RF-3 family GTPase [Chloroflexota bacterium]